MQFSAWSTQKFRGDTHRDTHRVRHSCFSTFSHLLWALNLFSRSFYMCFYSTSSHLTATGSHIETQGATVCWTLWVVQSQWVFHLLLTLLIHHSPPNTILPDNMWFGKSFGIIPTSAGKPELSSLWSEAYATDLVEQRCTGKDASALLLLCCEKWMLYTFWDLTFASHPLLRNYPKIS